MRKILSVILGVLTANGVFFLVSILANRIYPTPSALLDPQTPEDTALRVAAATTNGLLLVLLGGALGGLVGGFIGARTARDRTFAVTSAIGGLLLPWALYSFYVFFPARLWFPAGMLIAFLLSTYLGGVAARKSLREEKIRQA